MNPKKKIAFTAVAVLFSLFLLEIGVRGIEWALSFSSEGETQNFVTYRNKQPVFQKPLDGKSGAYIRTQHHPFILPDLHFPEKKPPNTFRIFCLGGSAALGWPHAKEYSYPHFLRQKLQQLYPSKNFEIINLGALTYASYRVKVVFEEILQYEPDLVVVYSGNNEFLERVLYDVDALLAPWKHIALIRAAHQIATDFRRSQPVVDVENYRPTFQIDIAMGNHSPLKLDKRQFEKVVAHYRSNLVWMAEKAQEKDFPLMLLTVPVNQRDWKPHVSVHSKGLDAETLEQWQAAYANGKDAREQRNMEEAARQFRKALQLDPAFAEVPYLLGKICLETQDILSAKKYFRMALEKDAYPFRALPVFNETVRETAKESGAWLVDAEHLFYSKSEDGIVGSELLIDHVHPVPSANELIAQQVAEMLVKKDALGESPSANLADCHIAVPDDAGQTLAVMQHLFVIYRVLLQFDKTAELLEACEQLPESEKNTQAYWQLTRNIKRYIAIAKPYAAWMEAEKRGILGDLFTKEEQAKIIGDYVEMCRLSLSGNMGEQAFQEFVPEEQKALLAP